MWISLSFFLPYGQLVGATHLYNSEVLRGMISSQNSQQKPLAAICAAPAVVFSPMGILLEKSATCYPAPKFRSTLTQESNLKVVQDGHIITSQGPGTAMEFALKLIEVLFGADKSASIAKELLF